MFDSFGEMVVEPSFDPTKNKKLEGRYASVKFGEVSVEKPTFFADDKELEFLPWHSRLQNMTYSSRIKVSVQVEVKLKTFLLKLSKLFLFVNRGMFSKHVFGYSRIELYAFL